jgi:DNA-binding transcriptional MerR regulator
MYVTDKTRDTMKTDGYSIKDLETLSGIKAHTIRIWEKRYELLNPQRTETNIRYYTDDDLRRILNVSLLVRHGFKISKVAKWESDEIRDTVVQVTKSKSSEDDYIERLLLYMVNFDNKRFYKLLGEIEENYDLEDTIYNVAFPLFERIGTFWQVGSIFPAQEHYVTHIMRQKIIAAIDKIGLNDTRDKTILFFLPENELHELSLLFYSYLAHKSGFNVIYLGQFVPFEDLKKLQSHVEVDFVFTAFINSKGKEDIEKYLVALKALFEKQKIFITGWQVNHLQPALPRNVKTVKDYKEFKKYLG